MFLSFLIWNIGEVERNALGNYRNWYRILLVFLAGTSAALVLIRNSQGIFRALTLPSVLLLAYGAVALFSSLWVPGIDRSYSLYAMWKSLEIIIDMLLVVAVLSYRDAWRFALTPYQIITALFAILLVVWTVEALLFPSAALVRSPGVIPYSLTGVLPVMHQNGFGFICAVVAFRATCTISRKRGRARLLFAPLLLLALVLLILAQSRTPIVGLGVALIVYALFARRLRLLVLLGSLGIAAAFTALSGFALNYLLRGQNQELLTTMSGRTHGWQAAWELFRQAPFAGHGFAAAARTEILGLQGASTLHGSVFDVLVGVGLIGFIPWMLALFIVVRWALRRAPRYLPAQSLTLLKDRRAEMLGILALIGVRNITHSDLAMHNLVFMLFLSVLVYLAALRSLPRSPVSASGPGLPRRSR